MLTHIDLFSGIGGFALAARWAGFQTVQFVEIDPFCQKVLNKNFPGVPIHEDITTYTYRNGLQEPGAKLEASGNRQLFQNQPSYRGSPFILTGGFPCQPYSCAGKRRGDQDDRALWPEMLRVISESKPRYVIAENVAGFINMGLDDCISSLEAEGYEVQAFIIPACAVNAPHRRDRVWIIAHLGGEGLQRFGSEYKLQEGQGKMQISGEHCDAPDTQYSQCPRFGQHSREILSEQETGRYSETSTWNEPWLEVATRLCRVDDGVSRKLDETGRVPTKLKDKTSAGRVHRLKALGNAIVPQVAYEIMKVIGDINHD
jgi:DNA (cytosine-5)-methyltransferase 1